VKTDNIKEIKIDDFGRFCLYPENAQFDYIYRAAAEVNWDAKDLFLYSPKPREWSYFNWYLQIIAAVRNEYGYILMVTENTKWTNIADDSKQLIIAHKWPN